MEHKTPEELSAAANVVNPSQMTRDEKLERWAMLLEADPMRKLATLSETEWKPEHERVLLRADHSVLTVAYDDPLLRLAGLRNDTYGEAIRFFKVSDWQLHEILCDCHYGARVEAHHAARGVRRATSRSALEAALSATVIGAVAATGLVALLI